MQEFRLDFNQLKSKSPWQNQGLFKTEKENEIIIVL